ncbi:MAG: nuclear transport factor 2 family protein [Nitrospirota bacterium]|nr:nuclear transport factor 2 family protein [Nitrospirota bacterium]MDE3243402.1 nuclear transport factor 2 family protein [Nitrospirota bacterium]
MFTTRRHQAIGTFVVVILLYATIGHAADLTTPEGVLRALVQANENKDMATIAKFMAHDGDIVSYTIEGRKYVGWPDFARDMETEFKDAMRIEIPITELKVWTRGETAWFAMELDYIRYLGSGKDEVRMLLPLRETGVMERRNGQWMLVSFHESFRSDVSITPGTSSSNQAFPSLK